MTTYPFIGVDLGQQNDFTAICVVEATPTIYEITTPSQDPEYHRPMESKEIIESTPISHAVRHLERAIGIPYPEVVRKIIKLQRTLGGRGILVVDHTGCGRPVVDMMREVPLDPIAITITGGDAMSHDGMDFRIPKRDLVGALVVALQTHRLKIAKSLPDADTLTAELLNFRVKISERGHDSYEAWREGQHDDLVLSVALAVWAAEYMFTQRETEIFSFDDIPYEISPI
ncbi:MAG: hypothetical protein WC502_09195 [Methanolinea sp.]|jgi:hypothetical protein